MFPNRRWSSLYFSTRLLFASFLTILNLVLCPQLKETYHRLAKVSYFKMGYPEGNAQSKVFRYSWMIEASAQDVFNEQC